MLKALLLLLIGGPLYYIQDPLGKGIEPLLKNRDIKIIKQVDQHTWLVEGELEKVNTGIYRIARYFKPKGKVKHPSIKALDIEWDPFIDSVLSTISIDSLKAFIQRLQNFKTRYAYTDSCRAAEEWLKIKLSHYVDSSKLWGFNHNDTWMQNVIGYKTGQQQQFVMITSHLDAITSEDPYNFAPGADDNASGTAVVLEAARILKDIETDLSIRFVPFTAEELGLIGSEHYADYIYTNSEPLVATLNFDMVAYQTPDGHDFEIYGDSTGLAFNIMKQVAELYTPTNNIFIPEYTWGSDHAPFALYGYDWTFVIESNYHLNPNYHKPTDLLSTLNDTLLLNAAKIGIGTLLYITLCPYPPENFAAYNVGTGDSLMVKWNKHPWESVTYYTLYMGISPNYYTDTLNTADTLIFIGNLLEDSTYYMRVRANTPSHKGMLSKEISITLHSKPVSPSLITISPSRNAIQIAWRKNTELDLIGYNIYRKSELNSNFIKINDDVLTDTVYIDSPLVDPYWFSYYVTALDSAMNESEPSCTLSARPVTLSNGVGIVDEFRAGNGNPFSPSESMQKAFLDTVFSWIEHDIYNIDSTNITLSQLGIHPIILVWADDYTENLANDYIDEIKKYLSCGGRVIFSGWKPSQNFLRSSYNTNINDTILGLPVDSIYLSTTLDFQRATPYGTYPSLPLDEDKLPPNFNGTLLNIEGYKTNEDNIFYLFDSSTDDPFWESIPCGLVNHDSTIFYFGFPLYYIETDSVKSLLSYIIENTVNRKEKNYLTPEKPKVDLVVKGKKLFYNIDNPQPRLNLKIELYNVLGQRVLQKSSQRPKGIIKLEKYKCGIYFAIIKLNNTIHRKKIILID